MIRSFFKLPHCCRIQIQFNIIYYIIAKSRVSGYLQLATFYRANTIPLTINIMWIGKGAYRQVKHDGCHNVFERLMYNIILYRIKKHVVISKK